MIVGCCIYYDEKPSWLAEGLASLAPLVDGFIYLDGGYALYPGAMERPASDVECAHALHDMAKAVDRSLLHYRPSQPFYGNEVEKRNMYIGLANALPGVDDKTWLLVFDGDLVATKVSGFVKRDLEESDLLVAEYGWTDTPSLDDDASRFHMDGITKIRGLYRNIPELAYGPAHYVVSGVDPDTGDAGWLWGQQGIHEPWANALDCSTSLVFEHRRSKRIAGRNKAAAQYYELRDQAGVEALGRTYTKDFDGNWIPIGKH